jgi:hypothetical protein
MAIVSGPLRRWAPAIAGAILAAIVGFALWTAVGVGGSNGTTPVSPNSPAQLSALARYSEQAAIRSGAGNADGAPPAPELVPLPPSAFVRPVDQYRAYAIVQLGAMERQIAALEAALAATGQLRAPPGAPRTSTTCTSGPSTASSGRSTSASTAAPAAFLEAPRALGSPAFTGSSTACGLQRPRVRSSSGLVG